ncbi:MAG: LysM peptidoglycan-binding domain-containing protein [Clostridia bacterium]|nr:LysM peptidoglycan-binding domain-containing protein [Clostridia bacterium]
MGLNQGYCPSGRFWRVKAGDTLFKIASQVGTTIAELKRLNPSVNPYNLQIGQSLCLPPEKPPCASGIYWTVASGDSLYTIAKDSGTTVERLLELNPGIDPLNLQEGMNICLPG